MKDMWKALQGFKSSGYKFEITLTSKDYFPLDITVEDGYISLSDENGVICTIAATKTEGEGQIVIDLGDRQIDVMEQARKQMREALL